MRRFPILSALLLALALVSCAACATAPLAQAMCSFSSSAGDLPATSASCPLGTLAAAAAVDACGADFAILPGGLFSGTLEAGAVYESDLARVIAQDADLVTVSITPKALYALLEDGVRSLTIGDGDRVDAVASASDRYPQTAGFSWTCDASAPAGARILEVCVDGAALDAGDDHTRYTLAATASIVGPDGADTGLSVRQALAAYARSRGTLHEVESSAAVIGTASYPLIDRFPIAALVCGLVLLFALASIPKIKYEKHFSFRPRLSMFQKRKKPPTDT